MRNFDNYSCLTRHVLKEHLQWLWRTALVALAVLTFATNATAQVVAPDPNTSCTSNDLEIVEATLTGATECYTCIEGQPTTSVLTLAIHNKTGSTRTSFAFWANLEVTLPNGQVTNTVITGCNGPIPGNTTHELPFGEIQYVCGSTLKLTNIFLAWTDASQNEDRQCPLDPANISPKCGKLAEIEITPPLSVGIASSTAPCVGEANGSITASAQGGEGPYSYTLLPGNITNSTGVFTGLAAGTYTINVADANSCRTQVSHTLTEVMCCVPPTITAQPVADAACVGEGASFTVAYSGGTPAPTIQWEVNTGNGTWTPLTNTGPYSGITSATLTIATTTLAMNGYTYRAVLTSGNCEPVTTNGAALTVYGLPTVYSLQGGSYCAGSTALGTITLSDSETGVMYQLYTAADATVGSPMPGDGEAIVWTGIAAGTGYYVVATGPGNCTSTTNSVNVVANPNPVATASVAGMLTCSVTSVQLSGSANIAVASYAWTGPGGFTSALQNPTVGAAGTYVLTVTTAAGCTDTDEVVVEEDDELPTVTAGTYGPLCIDAAAIVLGGTPAAGTWTGTGIVAVNGGYQFSPATAGVGSHLLTYSYTATNGCTATSTTTIVVNGLPAAYTLTGGSYCTGTSPAGAAVTLSDSDTGVSYQLQVNNGGTWTNVEGAIVAGTGSGISFGIQPVGSYRVLATNTATGCDDAFGNATVRVSPLFSANAGQDQTLTCTNTSVTLTGTSTDGDVTFAWSGPGGFTASTATIQVSTAGTYTLTVTNPATGCSATDTVEVGRNNELPDARVASSSIPVIKCGNGEVTLLGVSNTPGVTFRWTGPNGFTSTEQNVTVSVGGTYTLTVTNPATGCSASATESVVDARRDLNANAGPDKVLTCTVNQVVLQGTTDYDGQLALGYEWRDSNGALIALTQNITVTEPGTYTFRVHDIYSGCNDSDVVVVTGNTDSPVVNIRTDTNPVLKCSNNDIEIQGGSPTPGAVYSWVGPNGFTATTQNITVSVGGIYTLTVTNPATGCSASKQVEIYDVRKDLNANAGPDMVLTCTVNQVTLQGSSITAGALGYHWTASDGGRIVSGQSTLNPVVDAPGTYILYVVDIYSGCNDTDIVVVTRENTQVNVSAQGGALDCVTGTLRLTGSSTTAGVVYSWIGPGGFTSSEQNPVVNMAGEYTLTARIPNSDCAASTTVTVVPAAGGTRTEVTCYVIDFEQDAAGLITSTTTNAGEVVIVGQRRTPEGPIALGNHAAIFDTGMPTGDDADLHTMDWGNVLIVNQDRTGEPNDNQWGGVLELDFSAFGPVTMTSLRALDIDEYEDWSWVVLYDGDGNELYRVQLQPLGDNSRQTVDLGNTRGVMMMRVYLDGTGVDYVGSGAIDDIRFCIERQVEEPCQTPQPEPENCFVADFDQEETGLIESTTTNAGVIGILGRARTSTGPIALGNHAAIFNSQMPTGDDDDLYTADWGNVLIINQDRTSEPNDNQWGGILELDFSAFGPVTMYSLKALDIDEYEDWSWVVLYDGNGNELYRVQLQPLGNNSQQQVDLGATSGVMLMKVYLDGTGVDFVGSGAIDDIRFCIDGNNASTALQASRASALKAETVGIEASAYPMPFTDRTTIEFRMAEAQDYVVQLYDSKGQLVRELQAGKAGAGELVTVEVEGSHLADGLYFANIVGKAGIKKSVKLLHRR
ncbi:T9SS type A sorting domain-containing protein [Pontibacter burrus]|uniref:Ig-like domain-containing protein n=1 Tax=Pontibacter burrus TaxID=2704466 RepID=A0A6B3LRQ5_9BACT|nr:hypothetical protein [Pontibacter burrus]NEM99509.1 hypothetical protein [Pontibacter burrus]